MKDDIKFQEDYKYGFKDEDVSVLKTDVGLNEDIVKVHIRALNPGDIINYAQRYGELLNFKLVNLHIGEVLPEEEEEPLGEKVEYAMIGVSAGQGIKDFFKDIIMS